MNQTIMATKKRRINISLPKDIEKILKLLAKRDDVPEATKAVHLIKTAIEIDEDAYWAKLAEERDNEDDVYISHEEAWS